MFLLRSPLFLIPAGAGLLLSGCHDPVYREMYSPRGNHFVAPVEKAPVLPPERRSPVTPPAAMPDAGAPAAPLAPAIPGLEPAPAAPALPMAQ